jgi:hypothetical protein
MVRLGPIVFALLALLACTAANPDYEGIGLDAKPDAVPTLDPGPEAGSPEVGGPLPDPPSLDALADTAAPDLNLPDLPPVETAAPDVPGALGQPCSTGAGCASGFCVHGVCCNNDCRQLCWSCTLPAAPGTCTMVPSDQDPHDDCPAEAPSTCGRSGVCNGAGACKVHEAGTQCRAQTCAAGVETAANLCDGAGKCNAGTSRSCPSTECSADACAVQCSATVACASGSVCVAGRCTGNGPALHLRLDETSGTVAADASGNGYAAMYSGEPTLPVPSTSVPSTTFANPRSLSFPASGHPGLSMPIDGRLQSSNEVTISAWFRATSVPPSGAVLFSLNSDVMMKIGQDTLEVDKRKSNVDGMLYAIATARDVKGHLDGRWHHLAGVFSSKGIDLYFDGALRDHDANTQPILYRANGTLWIGREAPPSIRDYRGELDDVRMYNRALSANEIAALAGGAP